MVERHPGLLALAKDPKPSTASADDAQLDRLRTALNVPEDLDDAQDEAQGQEGHEEGQREGLEEAVEADEEAWLPTDTKGKR